MEKDVVAFSKETSGSGGEGKKVETQVSVFASSI